MALQNRVIDCYPVYICGQKFMYTCTLIMGMNAVIILDLNCSYSRVEGVSIIQSSEFVFFNQAVSNMAFSLRFA